MRTRSEGEDLDARGGRAPLVFEEAGGRRPDKGEANLLGLEGGFERRLVREGGRVE